MSNKPQESQQNGADEDTRHLVRESHAMRSVVRNMVANMESVLNDLQGIMGDIQSLVVQIDTVTDKIDKQCGAHGDSSDTSSLTTSQHCVRKPQFVHGTNLSSVTAHNALYSHIDSEKTSRTPADSMSQSNDIPSHNVLHIRAFRRDHGAGMSPVKQHEQSRSQSSEVSLKTDMKREIRIPCSSKCFSHFSKDGGGIVSPSGGIAIVYPTIKGSPPVHADDAILEIYDVRKTEKSSDKMVVTKTSEGSLYMQNSSPVKRNNVVCNSQHIWLATPFQDNETKKGIQATAKQRHGITSVYNKSFQPVTPTEQRSPVIPVGYRHSHAQASKIENLRPSVSSKPAWQDSKLFRVSYPTPEKSPVSNSSSHKYCTIGGSLSKSFQTLRESSIQNQCFIPSSPLLKRSSTKVAYSKVHGSPASSRSPGSIRRPGTENYYYSIESDLDSDAVIENLDNLSLTPDIDWSYLNLVGNDNCRDKSTRILETPSSDHAYEIPVVPGKVTQPFHMLQTSPDVIDRLPVIKVQAVAASEPYIMRDSDFTFHGHISVETIYNSPVIAHVFCSEVSSFKTSGYCGCYESVMDSVLENIAGFESFEEACEDLDNNEAINETYVSFEDEFEEDDWDMGMRSDDQDEYELPSFSMQALYGYHYGLFERLEAIDDNKNIFAAADNIVSVKGRLFSKDADNGRGIAPSSTTEGYNYIVNPKISSRRMSPAFNVTEMYDDPVFPGAAGNSFTDEDCCAIKPSVTNQHQNFILWHKSSIPNELRLFNDDGTKSSGVAEYETEISSSDDTSCQAIGTGSPMSFSSPEAALTSPDTDRFVTSSEGDDLFTSQDEAYFNFSEKQDNANLSTARANMLQLRREFFESLYNVCDKREKERLQDNDLKTLPEENTRYDQNFSRTDNNKDNISEAGSYQEDITSYNKSINTWTAYAMVHLQADDISDSTSDIFNDNNVNCSMTSSYLDADNIGNAPGNQALTC